MRLSNKFHKVGVIFTVGKDMRLRLLATMLVGVFWIGVLVPTASAIGAVELERRQNEAVQKAQEQARSHIKPLEEEANTKPDKFDYAGPIANEAPSKTVAENTKGIGPPSQLGKDSTPVGEPMQEVNLGVQVAPRELINKRTETSDTFLNKDGTRLGTG